VVLVVGRSDIVVATLLRLDLLGFRVLAGSVCDLDGRDLALLLVRVISYWSGLADVSCGHI